MTGSSANHDSNLSRKPLPTGPAHLTLSENENTGNSIPTGPAHPSLAENGAADFPQTSPELEKESAFERMAKTMGMKEGERKALSALNNIEAATEAGYKIGCRTVDTPTFQALWNGSFSKEHFTFDHAPSAPRVIAYREKAIGLVVDHIMNGTIKGEEGKLSETVLQALGPCGWWGQMVDDDHGGQELSKFDFARNMSAMSVVNPYVGGAASVHGSIGAVWPIRHFGNAMQKDLFLPDLASGMHLSAFAITEPSAGVNVTEIKTTATRHGDGYLINGEKLFITGVFPGRLVCVVAKLTEPIVSTVTIEGNQYQNVEKRAVFIVKLPDTEKTPNFEILKYGVWALGGMENPLGGLHNRGLVFKDFFVGKENRIDPTIGGTALGDGLTVAFSALNGGRVALCANAVGGQKATLANAIPWAQFRITFSDPIEKRSLIQSCVGNMAGNVVACEAMRDFVARLMDNGFNCEMEAINAKIFGSECQDEVTDYFLEINGGRSFLKNNPYLQMLVEAKAAKTYEGPNDLLSLKHEKSMLDDFNKKYAEKLFDTQLKPHQKIPAAANLVGWVFKRGFKWLGQKAVSAMNIGKDQFNFDKSTDTKLHRLSRFAEAKSENYWMHTLKTLFDYKKGLFREQTVLHNRSAQKMNLMLIKVICEWALTHPEPFYREAALLKATQLKNRYLGKSSKEAVPDSYGIDAANLGRKVLKGEYNGIDGALLAPIAKIYDPETGRTLMEEQGFRILRVSDLKDKAERESAQKKKEKGMKT
jgi:alkylation response protein AidB-like acyl-CoA dehydrogenase